MLLKINVSIYSMADKVKYVSGSHVCKKAKIDLDADKSSDDSDEIVEMSVNQRHARHGEPKCILCSRYGAYICDQYDVDVCSQECKLLYAAQMSSKSKKYLDLVAKYPVVSFVEKACEQRIALPQEESCLFCPRFGAKEIFSNGKVCSKECMSKFLSNNDRILKSPQLKVNQLAQSSMPSQECSLKVEVKKNDKGLSIQQFYNFSQLNLNPTLYENILSSDIKIPTTFQSHGISIIAEGNDLLGCGRPRSGKSYSYIIPLINRVSAWTQYIPNCVLSVILVPTRDAAVHIEKICKALCEGIPKMKTALVIGGASETQQQYRLDSTVQIVIATPGRLLKLKPDLSKCFMVVLDDSFALLDGSFMEQVKSILQMVPERHQTIMMTSTISPNIEYLATQLLFDHVTLTVGKPSHTADLVRQVVIWVENEAKKKKLLSILQDKKLFQPPTVVFVESRIGAVHLANYLINNDILCAVLHGDKYQDERNKILREFSEEKYPVLVCTGALGRGVSLPVISQVVIFDFPLLLDNYITQVSRAYSNATNVKNQSSFRFPKFTRTAFVFLNNSNKGLFLCFYDYCIANSIKIPIQLSNSNHLAYQKQRRNYKL